MSKIEDKLRGFWSGLWSKANLWFGAIQDKARDNKYTVGTFYGSLAFVLSLAVAVTAALDAAHWATGFLVFIAVAVVFVTLWPVLVIILDIM